MLDYKNLYTLDNISRHNMHTAASTRSSAKEWLPGIQQWVRFNWQQQQQLLTSSRLCESSEKVIAEISTNSHFNDCRLHVESFLNFLFLKFAIFYNVTMYCHLVQAESKQTLPQIHSTFTLVCTVFIHPTNTIAQYRMPILAFTLEPGAYASLTFAIHHDENSQSSRHYIKNTDFRVMLRQVLKKSSNRNYWRHVLTVRWGWKCFKCFYQTSLYLWEQIPVTECRSATHLLFKPVFWAEANQKKVGLKVAETIQTVDEATVPSR